MSSMPIVFLFVAVIAFMLGMAYKNAPVSHATCGGLPKTPLSKADAMRILAVTQESSVDDIKASYRRLLQKLHPDQGGSAYLTDLVIQAKNTLIKEDA